MGTGTNGTTPMYAISAALEGANAGNTGSITNYQGATATGPWPGTFTKGAGSGYVLVN